MKGVGKKNMDDLIQRQLPVESEKDLAANFTTGT
jgi:hypothetical protein